MRDSVTKKLKIANKKYSSKVDGHNNWNGKNYQRIQYHVRTTWSAVEQDLLTQMMNKENEYSRAALVRRCIHERAMRTLGENYYKIIEKTTD